MRKFAIIDIETTGGNPRMDKITEICIHLFDGEQVIDSFTTLINPQTPIPYFITKMTGITNEMVKKAPLFEEVAKRIVEITEGAVFVAHNVRFDYGFVQRAFRNLGYTYTRSQLCTVRLTQKLIPDLPSYSLGNICKSINIPHKKAHRAYGDAEATLILFQKLMSLENTPEDTESLLKSQMQEVKLPPHLSKETFDALPDDTGVYYMHNLEGEVIYVGKSNSIKDRIASHFREAHKKSRALRMIEEVMDISYELTGNELIALLREDEEIKKIQPRYNRRQKRQFYHFGIFSEPDAHGYLRLYIERLTEDGPKPEAIYSSRRNAEAAMIRKIEQHNLCQNLCGLSTGKGACFHYQIHVCKGACILEEPANSYNLRVEEAIAGMNYGKKNFVVVGDGRDFEEQTLTFVENGVYIGFMYIHSDEIRRHSWQSLKGMVTPKRENPDILHVLRNFIRKNPKTVVVF